MSEIEIDSPAKRRELMRNMLLGQHSVSFTTAYTELPEATVTAMATKLCEARKIPRVRA